MGARGAPLRVLPRILTFPEASNVSWRKKKFRFRSLVAAPALVAAESIRKRDRNGLEGSFITLSQVDARLEKYS